MYMCMQLLTYGKCYCPPQIGPILDTMRIPRKSHSHELWFLHLVLQQLYFSPNCYCE